MVTSATHYYICDHKYLPKEYKQVGTQTDFSLCTCNCNVARGIQNPYRLDIQQEHSYTKNPPISTTERPSTSRKRQSLQSETVTSNVSVSEHANYKLTNVTDTNDEPSSDRNINTQSIIEIEPVEVELSICHSHDHQNVTSHGNNDSGPTIVSSDVSMSIIDTSISTITSVHDDSYHIDESELGSESETENKPDEEIDHCRETKYLVFDSSLKKLFSRCLECGVAVIDVSTTTRGSLLTAKMTCSNMHDVVWHSQPLLNRMALGNLLLSAAILFSGNTFQSFSDCFSFLKIQCFQKTTYMTIQDKYLIPVINNAWSAESQRVKQSLRQKEEVRLSGDGRCDSPGYSAKYSLYTFMDQSTEKVVDMSLTQVTEVANSNAMEKAGFIKTLDRIIDDNIPVSTVATDRHVQIGATMKKRYPTISHQYDVWHLSKSIKKKLAEFGKKKKYSSLLPWIQSVSNHLWWSAATCEGNQQSLRERWTSIVHHVVNVHSWSGNQSFHECNHPEIPDTSNIDWLEIDSPPRSVERSRL
ncbi:uncharacterized protein [Ptychodera flava]|uniref:uncharacterized protein n=1 Tax=Ptychodera flava TaxID=63121 RepID=UPI00396A9C00